MTDLNQIYTQAIYWQFLIQFKKKKKKIIKKFKSYAPFCESVIVGTLAK